MGTTIYQDETTDIVTTVTRQPPRRDHELGALIVLSRCKLCSWDTSDAMEDTIDNEAHAQQMITDDTYNHARAVRAHLAKVHQATA